MSSSSNSTPNHDEPDMGMAIGYPVTSPYGSDFTRNTSYGFALGTPLVTHNYNYPTLPRLNNLGLSFGPFPSSERPGGSSRYSSLFNGGLPRGTMNMYVDMTMVPPSVPYGSFTENTSYGSSSSSRDPLPSPHGLSLDLSLGPSNYVRSSNNNNTSVNPSLFRGGAARGTRDMTMVPSLDPYGSSSRDLLPTYNSNPHGLSLELSLGPSNHIGSNINININNNNTSVNPSLYQGGVTRETRNMTMVRSSAPYGSFTENTSYGSSSRSPFPSYNFSPYGLSLEGPSSYIRSNNNNNFYYSSSFDDGVTRATRDMNMVPSLLPYFSFIENSSYAYSLRDHLPSYNYIPYGLSNELYLQPSNHIGGGNNNNVSNVYASLFEIYLQPSNRIGGSNNISNVYTSLFDGGVIEENMGMDLSLCPLVPPYNFYSGNPFESNIGEVPLSCPPTPTNSLCSDENVLGSGYSENIIPQGETNVIVVQNDDDEVNMVNDEDNMVNDEVNDEDNMVNDEEDMVNDEDNGED